MSFHPPIPRPKCQTAKKPGPALSGKKPGPAPTGTTPPKPPALPGK